MYPSSPRHAPNGWPGPSIAFMSPERYAPSPVGAEWADVIGRVVWRQRRVLREARPAVRDRLPPSLGWAPPPGTAATGAAGLPRDAGPDAARRRDGFQHRLVRRA